MSTFEIKSDSFYLNGKPLRILSGAMHYFRILPDYWEDRLLKLKAAGLNTVETYVPWNFHETREGEFNFTGMHDVERYIELAGKLGLHVIVRPSPYICAEWEFGGLPAWLLKNRDIELRCADAVFMEKIKAYYKVLLPRLVKHQCTQGGPVLMMQIENEYGSYGNDSAYLRFLEQQMRENGIDVPLFTSDGEQMFHLTGGTLPEVFKVINFSTSDPSDTFRHLKAFQPDMPIMCGEFWMGWFDHWGENHHAGGDAVKKFRSGAEGLLKMGAHFNLYMFHGGTTFGYMNGANTAGTFYQPDITSYDYDCGLDEQGNPTEKYYALRALIEQYIGPLEPLNLPEPPKVKAFGMVALTQCADLFSQLGNLSGNVNKTAGVKPMEYFGQNYGFILYRTRVRPVGQAQVKICDIHDRAHVFLDGKREGIIYRNDEDEDVSFKFEKDETALDILVENMGRVNFGPLLKDFKGITDYVAVGGQKQFGWETYNLELDDIGKVAFSPCEKERTDGPVFLRGRFDVDEPADTFLRCDKLAKGQVWVNGFNLGRYWTAAGPQKTLYIPAALLKQGENELVIFETDSAGELCVELTDKSDLG